MLPRFPKCAVVFLGLLLALPVSAAAQGGTDQIKEYTDQTNPTPPPPPNNSTRQLSYTIEVTGTDQWTDTKIDLLAGDRVSFTATGSVKYLDTAATGPDGLPRAWKDLLRVMPVNNLGRGALVGRIGPDGSPQLFSIGQQRQVQATNAGRLFLGINQPTTDSATGSFKVAITIAPAAPRPSDTGTNTAANPDSLMQIVGASLAQLPRRVADAEGNPGDMVNFMLVGSEDNVRLTLESAGWVKVDRTTKDAVMHGLLSSVSKQGYVEMPMSELNLFGRPQDYGFAHADPLTVATTRHHFRLWKAPFQIGGQDVWAGAGTHDIGIERDQRNPMALTHKIDPNVDIEREYIAQSFASTGMVLNQGYVTPKDPFTGGNTATGGSFHSDGRVLVVMLTPSGRDASASFADIFCSVLGKENPDTGQWGDCSQYITSKPSGSAVDLAPLANKYRVLVLPGFLSSCVSSTQALQKGQTHLHDVHGMTVEYLALPNMSSESNGKLIADYLTAHANDPRKYIVIGYSKGAPDAETALETNPQARSAVAAFVSLAGAIGGSPVANTLPSVIDRYAKALNLGDCQGDIGEAAKSLRSDVRHDFLSLHPTPSLPTYSFTAQSDRANTSKMLLQAWQMLSAYDADQDSQLTRHDAIVPGSIFLGSAHADHLAVALGFEDSGDAKIKSLMDHNHYPRAALMESLIRAVVADLDKNAPPPPTPPPPPAPTTK